MTPLLRSLGYTVTVASTGRDALDAFEREQPDVVILDLGLPDMDGSEVCRQVRERAETPILILSARGGEKDKVAALDRDTSADGSHRGSSARRIIHAQHRSFGSATPAASGPREGTAPPPHSQLDALFRAVRPRIDRR